MNKIDEAMREIDEITQYTAPGYNRDLRAILEKYFGEKRVLSASDYYQELEHPEVGDVVRRQDGQCGIVTAVYVDRLDIWRRGLTHYNVAKSETRPATPEEIAEFYTVEGRNGEKARFYRDTDGDIKATSSQGYILLVSAPAWEAYAIERNAMLAYFNLTLDSPLIMPYEKSEGNYEPPKGGK